LVSHHRDKREHIVGRFGGLVDFHEIKAASIIFGADKHRSCDEDR
jgi:hypothetical protein